MTRSITQTIACHAFLLPHANHSTSSSSSSSTSEGTRAQLGTLCRQLYIANTKLQAISHSSGAEAELGLLRWELNTANAQIQAKEMQIDHLQTHCRLLNAEKGAAEAHCTLRSMKVEDLCKQLDEQKHRSKCQCIHSTTGRFLTLPQAEAAFCSQQEEWTTRLAAQAQQQAQRDAADRRRELQRAENALNKTFDAPLGSYTHKDDLKDIAAAFGLDQKGTIAKILGHCQRHMESYPELVSKPRFTRLFAARHSRVHRAQVTDTSTIGHGALSSLSFPAPSGPSASPAVFPAPNLLPYPNSYNPLLPPSNFDV